MLKTFLIGSTIFTLASCLPQDRLLPKASLSNQSQDTKNTAPTATVSTYITLEDQSIENALLQGRDAEGDVLTYTIQSEPVYGRLTILDQNTGLFRYQPQEGFAGADSFSYSISDGTLESDPVTSSITITPINNAPEIESISTQYIHENSILKDLSIAIDEGGGIDENLQTLTVEITASNLILFPEDSIDYEFNDSAIIDAGANPLLLTLTPAPNKSGTSEITITVTDDFATDPKVTTIVFEITVSSVNDNPTIGTLSNRTLQEDSPLTFTISADEGGGSAEDGQIITLSGRSDLTRLIATSSFDFTQGDDEVRDASANSSTLTITPELDQNGVTWVTIKATDNGNPALSSSKSFLLTVQPVNDAPTLEEIEDQTGDEESVLGPIEFVVDEGGGTDENTQNLVISATSSNTDLVPNENISIDYTDDEENDATGGTLSITPTENATGTSEITITVSDQQNQNHTTTESFTIHISGINDSPTLSDFENISIQEDETIPEINFELDEGGGDDEDEQDLTVSVSSSNTDLIPNENITLNYTPDGEQDAMSGSLEISPAQHKNGTSTITIQVNDGDLSIEKSFEIEVTPSNDAPTISTILDQSGSEDSSIGPLSFNVDEGGSSDEDEQNLTITASSSNTGLIANENISINYSDDLEDDATSGQISFTPTQNQFGSSQITLNVSDGIETTSTTFNITINSVNDAPEIEDIEDIVSDEDQVISQNFVVDEGGETLEDSQSLVVTAISSNTALIPNENIQINYVNDGGSDATAGSLALTPNSNAIGTTTITISVNDQESSQNISTKSFSITVSPINDAPVLSNLDTQNIDKNELIENLTFTLDEGGGSDEDAQNITISVQSSNTALIANESIQINYNSDLENDATQGSLDITPNLNQIGSSTITLEISDGFSTSQTQFVINIRQTWWNSNWNFRQKISFNNSQRTTSNLTNLPVLIYLNNLNCETQCDTIDYDDFNDSDGRDLRFVDENNNLIPHEVEKWRETESGDEKSYIWVKVPSIAHSSNDGHIWMYYGANNVSSTSSSNDVWSDFNLKHHLGSVSGLNDSTTYSNNLLAQGTSLSIGKIEKSRYFDGVDDSLAMNNHSSLNFENDFEISFFINLQNTHNDQSANTIPLILKTDNSTNEMSISLIGDDYEDLTASRGSLQLRILQDLGVEFTLTSTRTSWSNNTWYQVVLQYNSSNPENSKIWVNGINNTQSYSNNGNANIEFAGSWIIGQSGTTLEDSPLPSNLIFQGKLDEIYFKNTLSSSDWIGAFLQSSENNSFTEIEIKETY